MAKAHPFAITFRAEEISHLIRALYRAINRPMKCGFCGKPAKHIRLELIGERITKLKKVCDDCEKGLSERSDNLWQMIKAKKPS
jgi:hypothetical protein